MAEAAVRRVPSPVGTGCSGACPVGRRPGIWRDVVPQCDSERPAAGCAWGGRGDRVTAQDGGGGKAELRAGPRPAMTRTVSLAVYSVGVTPSPTASAAVEFVVYLALGPEDVTIKPESLKVNPGAFTAFVSFPAPYRVSTLFEAWADGAPHRKIAYDSESDHVVLHFERADIAVLPVDTQFDVWGTFLYQGRQCTFIGSDEISSVVSAAPVPPPPGGDSGGQGAQKKTK